MIKIKIRIEIFATINFAIVAVSDTRMIIK